MDNLTDFLKCHTAEDADYDSVVKPLKKIERISIFDIFKAAVYSNTPFTDVISYGYDQFMLNRIVSMNEDYIDHAVQLTTMHNLTDEQHYNLLRTFIPSYYKFNKYMTVKKGSSRDEKRYIAHYFEIGLKDAEDYIRQMSDEEISEVLKKYTYGKNEMIKV